MNTLLKDSIYVSEFCSSKEPDKTEWEYCSDEEIKTASSPTNKKEMKKYTTTVRYKGPKPIKKCNS
jgi:hypothetical protein